MRIANAVGDADEWMTGASGQHWCPACRRERVAVERLRGAVTQRLGYPR